MLALSWNSFIQGVFKYQFPSGFCSYTNTLGCVYKHVSAVSRNVQELAHKVLSVKHAVNCGQYNSTLNECFMLGWPWISLGFLEEHRPGDGSAHTDMGTVIHTKTGQCICSAG
jgi:hypothetical protein